MKTTSATIQFSTGVKARSINGKWYCTDRPDLEAQMDVFSKDFTPLPGDFNPDLTRARALIELVGDGEVVSYTKPDPIDHDIII